MIIYIYDIKTLEIIAKPVAPSYEEFKEKPVMFYPNWKIKSHLASEIEFQNPIIINKEIREKNREELILLDNKIEMLQDGEYVEENQIIRIEAPEYLYKKIWNKEINQWQEGASQEEIKVEVNRLIDEYTLLEEQKERWLKYKFEIIDIENKIALNIVRRNYLLSIKTYNI